MIKLLGFLLVTVGSGMFGFSQVFDLKARLKELLDMEQSFLRLESEICRMERPLPEALCLAGIGMAEELFGEAAKGIEGGKSAFPAWEDALEQCTKRWHLNLKDAEVLVRFGEGMSAEDTEGQAKNLQVIRTLLQVQAEDAREQVEKQGKIYGSGGILVGLMIGIILL